MLSTTTNVTRATPVRLLTDVVDHASGECCYDTS